MQSFRRKMSGIALLSALAVVCPLCATAQEKRTNLKYSFGPGKVPAEYTQVLPDMKYTAERGFGFDLGSRVTAVDRGGNETARAGFCTSDQPFYFSVALPEGNYDVKLTLGDARGESDTRILSESRRLMLEKVPTQAGQIETCTITVNIRNSKLPGGGQVKLKDREIKGPVSRPCLALG